jgi:arsenate reductase-like glutaredoxin family protein
LSEAEIDALIGKRDYRDFLNSRNELFREKNMKESPPPRDEAIRLMSKSPNLIRRPVIVKGKYVIVGFDQDSVERLL